MMNRFIYQYILKPFRGGWAKGLSLLLLWTVAYIALPAVSGWFLAMCSVAFITANIMFAYLIPATVIRFLALLRTVTRYFERVENHKTALGVQRNIQLKIFTAVAGLPYFKKQSGNNPAILENSTRGVENILNHVLLWILPFSALIISTLIYFLLLRIFSRVIAVEFLISSALLLFVIPQFFYLKNKKVHDKLSALRDENNRELIESFRGRIEISKYGLQKQVTGRHGSRLSEIDRLENSLQGNSFVLQLVAGLGFSYTAAILFWHSGSQAIDAPMAIGIFFGILAQAELAEILFSGKSERNSVSRQVQQLNEMLGQGSGPEETERGYSPLESIEINNLVAVIPKTPVRTPELTVNIKKGEWAALFGETGKGKTTLLNGLFYPEYRGSGSIRWNGRRELSRLPVPQCIYVTQKALLLTGTLRENFDGHSAQAIEKVLETVDLALWYRSLPDGLDSWLGENGEILSGGQRKKLLLAQALLKQPLLLVVDEPTAGISSEKAIEIFRNIKREYPAMTVLMATHLKRFEALADIVMTI